MEYKLTNSDCIYRAADGAFIPTDPANTDYAVYLAWLSEGNTPEPADPPPTPTQAEIIAKYESALDAHLDAVAKAHRYNDRFSFALRAGFVGPYQSEGIVFATWMDTCNVQAFALLQSVLDGTAELPTIEDFIAALPTFVLP